tara:strand:- start:35 stop:190 length:156 start_codon:yes stop_codon:yes gene_type:complete
MPLQPKKIKVKKKVVKKKVVEKKPVYVAKNMTGTSTIKTKKKPRTIGGYKY